MSAFDPKRTLLFVIETKFTGRKTQDEVRLL
jgi:hypothetical protein